MNAALQRTKTKCRDCKYVFYDDIDGERYCRQGDHWDILEWEENCPDWCPMRAENRLIGVQNGVQPENQEPTMLEK